MVDERLNQFTALERVDFIIRHPWIILSAFLIIFNLFHAYALSLPPQYHTKSTILFESTGAAANRDAINAKKEAAEKILTGPNIDMLLAEIFKGSDQRSGGRAYEALANALRDPKASIKFGWEPKGASYLLTVGFTYSDPQLSYKSVVSAVDMVIKESEQKVTRELQANVAFYNGQLKLYQEKINAINKEVESIRAELIRRFPELSDDQKELITRSAGTTELGKEGAVKKYEVYEQAMNKLRLELADMEKKRDDLRKTLESGTPLVQFSAEGSFKEDIFLSEYSKAIASKELEIASLTAKGFKSEHPQIIQLQQEIEQLRQIRKKRIAQLRGGDIGSQEYEDAREEVKVEIDDLEMRIKFMKEKIRQLDESRRATSEELKASPVEGDIKQKVAKLVTLNNEKGLTESYYIEMKKKLADAELKLSSEKEDIGFKIEIVQEPKLPARPDAAKKNSLIFNGFLAALVLSGGIAYLLDSMRAPVHSSRTLTEAVQVPVLATIDKIMTQREVALEHDRLKKLAIGTAVVIIATRIIVAVLFR